jgi:hypothetical protein
MGISTFELEHDRASSTMGSHLHKIATEYKPSIAKNRSVNLLTNVCDEKVDKWLDKVEKGLKLHAPELCEEGVGGTYFLKDELGDNIAVFKPEDEEAFAVNNPKPENQGQPYKHGIVVGEAAAKEVAAYLLDSKSRFHEVPATVMVRCTHEAFYSEYEREHKIKPQPKTKVGSLQMYIPHDCASWDIGPSNFPVKEVHKIALLDCRLMNLDRHGGNILVEKSKGGYKLHPIDHGYSLPHKMAETWFEWLTWPQAKVPFDEETKAFVKAIDIDEDVELLRKELNLDEECLSLLRVSTLLLKKAVAAGLTLKDLGSFICRADADEPSRLEVVYNSGLQCDLNENEIASKAFELLRNTTERRAAG